MPDSTVPQVNEAIALVIPVYNAADRVVSLVGLWDEFLRGLECDYSLIVVDDGSSDGTGPALAGVWEGNPRVRVLVHEKRQGFGACLRSALEIANYPLIAYVLPNYPYVPADLKKLIDRLDQHCELPVFDDPVKPVAAAGCRTGRPVPAFWQAVGRVYRGLCWLLLGVPADPLPGWLGFREHIRSWVLWLTMGVPLTDVNCGLKVFRRSVFDRFPIQSDGDFAHAEIFAKLTVLSSLVAEELLAPAPDPIPSTEWSEYWKVFQSPAFHHALPDLSQPVTVEAPTSG